MFLLWGIPLYAAVRVKLLVVNPSETKRDKIEVRFDLPKEIKKEDVLDANGLDVDYDAQKDVYYVGKSIELGPKETREYKVVIQDKWNIPPENVDRLKATLSEKLASLERTDQYETAQLLAANIANKLDEVVKIQNDAASDINKKIEVYRVNQKVLDQLENDVLSLDYLASNAVELQEARTIRYIVEATNPSPRDIEMTVTNYLPKGVQPEYIVGNPGFEINYDNNLKQFFLTKNENLKAGETRKYDIEIKDMWSVSAKNLTKYKDESDGLTKVLADSKYKKLAELLNNEINNDIKEILSSQSAVSSLKDKVSLFQINSEKEARIKAKLERLKTLLSELVTTQQFFTVLKQQNPEAELKVADFKKKDISKVQVWMVVLYLVVFISLFAVFFAVYWFMKLSKDEKIKYDKIKKPKVEQPSV